MASPAVNADGLSTIQRLWTAIGELSENEVSNLRTYAKLRLIAWLGEGRDWRDVLHDAILTIASGSRHWPAHISLYTMLRLTIRSLTDVRMVRNTEPIEAADTRCGATGGITPERILCAKERLERIYEIFAEDPKARGVIDAFALGLTGPEIQQTLNITATELNTISRRITRRLDREEEYEKG